MVDQTSKWIYPLVRVVGPRGGSPAPDVALLQPPPHVRVGLQARLEFLVVQSGGNRIHYVTPVLKATYGHRTLPITSQKW